MEEIIYFSVNNWFCGEHYPPTENFKKWLGDDYNLAFTDDEWCKNNKLCVNYGIIDMSVNFTVSAPKSWVEKNCPELLPDKSYDYDIDVIEIKRNTHSDFVYTPEKDKPFIKKSVLKYGFPENKIFNCNDNGSFRVLLYSFKDWLGENNSNYDVE